MDPTCETKPRGSSRQSVVGLKTAVQTKPISRGAPAWETKPIVPGCPEMGADREDWARSLPPKGFIVRNKANSTNVVSEDKCFMERGLGQIWRARGIGKTKPIPGGQEGMRTGKTAAPAGAIVRNKANLPHRSPESDGGQRRGETKPISRTAEGRRSRAGRPTYEELTTDTLPRPLYKQSQFASPGPPEAAGRRCFQQNKANFRRSRKGQEPARRWRRQPEQLCETKPISAVAGRTCGRGVCHHRPIPPLRRRNEQG